MSGDVNQIVDSTSKPLEEVGGGLSTYLRNSAKVNDAAGKTFRESIKDSPWIERQLGEGVADALESPSAALSLIGGPAGALAIADAYAQAYSQAIEAGLPAPQAEVFAWSQAAPEAISVIPAGKVLERIPYLGALIKKKSADLAEGLVKKLVDPNIAAAMTVAKTVAGEVGEEVTTGTFQDIAMAAAAGQTRGKELQELAKEQAPKSIEEFMANRGREARAAIVMGAGGGALSATQGL